MTDWAINSRLQDDLSKRIGQATSSVVRHLDRHESENTFTGALGEKLLSLNDELELAASSRGKPRVLFEYRRFSEQLHEPQLGADGGFKVIVENAVGSRIEKAALFQAKIIKASLPPRQMRMKGEDANRLRDQCRKMLRASSDAVVLFYTPRDVYVVDACRFAKPAHGAMKPLAEENRLITLATYLGKWLPRCTRGDRRLAVVKAIDERQEVEHLIGLTITRNTT